MIFDLDRLPKGIVLVKVPNKGGVPDFQANPLDAVPLELAGRSDARVWRPDATTQQAWSRSTRAATAPLPSGFDATNHLQREPRTASFTAVLSDFPTVPSAAGVDGSNRANALWSGLQAWERDRAVVACISAYDAIPTCFISSLTLPRSPEDGSIIQCDITLQEIRVYGVEYVDSIDSLANSLGALRLRAGGVVIG